MAIIISTVNMKGGVGKTTLTVNLATCLAKNHGLRVLVVDLDSQISATLSLVPPHEFAKIRKGRRTLSYLIDTVIRPDISRKMNIHDIICSYICNIQGLDLLPGDIELYDEYIVSEMLHKQALEKGEADFEKVWNEFERVLISRVLEPIMNNYDYIIMDCAPGYNLLTRSGIAASDYYLLPARPEPLSVIGIQLLERRIARLKTSHKDTNPINLQLLGIVFILSGGILLGRYYQQVMKRVQQDFKPTQIFKHRIPMDVNVSKALDSFMPVVLSHPNSTGAKSFIKLTEELLAKLESSESSQVANKGQVNLKNLE
jgi:chromosome partitioning protein